jgi:hypothetical protein
MIMRVRSQSSERGHNSFDHITNGRCHDEHFQAAQDRHGYYNLSDLPSKSLFRVAPGCCMRQLFVLISYQF